MQSTEYFSRLPADIQRDWLPDRVRNLGWPPDVRLDSWTKVLGDSPERWRRYTWAETTVDLINARWREDTRETIQALSDACFRGIQNRFAQHIPHGSSKIQRIQHYGMHHGKLPSKLLAIGTTGGLFLVDGYHRVSWYYFTAGILGSAFPVSHVAECFLGEMEEPSQRT